MRWMLRTGDITSCAPVFAPIDRPSFVQIPLSQVPRRDASSPHAKVPRRRLLDRVLRTGVSSGFGAYAADTWHTPLGLLFVARKCFGKSEPNENNGSFVAAFRMVCDILPDDLYKFLSLNRLLRRAESVRPYMRVFYKRQAFEDPINVAQALDIAMGFVRVQLAGRFVNSRAPI